MNFQRNEYLEAIDNDNEWDVIVIGGGATGLGTALDSASRGFKTLLLEQADFAKGTSSRATKLVHGGVRYLAQGDVALVYEALTERGLLFKNAAHLVREQEFIIPCYTIKDRLMYTVGLTFYDILAGKKGFKPSKFLSTDKVLEALPGIKRDKLIGGVRYSDGQFDDARLAVNIAQTCGEKGGVALNYMKVTGILKNGGKVAGVKAVDTETNREYTLKAKAVVNATGVFVDEILQMDIPSGKRIVRPSQGVHLVLDRSFMNGTSALMIPKTEDGRVLFVVPWHDKLLMGTTDTPLDQHSLEPIALEKEIDFILKTASLYLKRVPTRADVLSVFAGLRPLAAPDKESKNTKEISRSHKLILSPTGLLTITGGKWTTYRRMAQDVVDKVIEIAGLNKVACKTKQIAIHGCTQNPSSEKLKIYGTDSFEIEKLIQGNKSLAENVIAQYSVSKAEVVWIVRNEMPRKIEDVLSRRLRVLFLDARSAILLAPGVAEIMATELRYSAEWQTEQVADFTKLANQYLLEPFNP